MAVNTTQVLERDPAYVYLLPFNESQVREICALVQSTGSVSTVLSNLSALRGKFGTPQALSILDVSRMPEPADSVALLHATMLLLFNAMKQPRDKEAYKNLLMQTFMISETYAQKLANGIEAEDKLTSFTARLKKWVTEKANWLGMGLYHINVDDADLDALYELIKLGQAVQELVRRAKLSAVNADVMLAPGQIASEVGDVSPDDEEANRQLEVQLRRVPGLTRNEIGDVYAKPHNAAAEQVARIVAAQLDHSK